MGHYFSEADVRDLSQVQRKAVESPEDYGPVLDYLSKKEDDFRTDDLLHDTNEELDPYRVSHLLGVFRDEFDIIGGEFRGGNYYWSPEIRAEGTWQDVKDELEELNQTKPTV